MDLHGAHGCGARVEPKSTSLKRTHTPLQNILETLALLAKGVHMSSLSQAKGFKEDKILRGPRKAARHRDVRFDRVQ
jgi:hypothetical protein